MPLKQIAELVEQAARGTPKSVIIPGGDRVEDLEVFQAIIALSFVSRCILVGDPVRIAAAAAAVGVVVDPDDIVATSSEEESAEKTVEWVQAGRADIILKGNISTPLLTRQILKLKNSETMSLCTLFQSPLMAGGRPMLLTDAGVTTVCNFSRMSAIIHNAAEVARRVMGIENPKVALLSANEKVIPSLPSSVLASDLAAAHWENMTVYGPLSLDLATSMESVRLKGVGGKSGSALGAVAGQADILVCPGLDAANILYKAIMALVEQGQAVTAGITMGVKVPYIILSRADHAETKMNSVALCAVFAEKGGRPSSRSAASPSQHETSAVAKAAAQLGRPVHRVSLVCVQGDVDVRVEAVRDGNVVDTVIVALEGFTDWRDLQQRISSGDDAAKKMVEAWGYRLAKAIGAMYVAAGRQTEALVFSGGLTQSSCLMGVIQKQVSHLATVMVFKG